MKRCIALVTLGIFTTIGLGADSPWPQFRGPNGSGIAEGQKPPVEFGPEKNVKWKVPAPSGLSSPVIAGDKLVITAFEGDKLYTVAYNRADGKEVWRSEAPAKQIEPFMKVESSPAASTCVTDGKRIVSYFGSCGLVCYDLDGKELWKFELPIAESAGGFGTGASPMLADGKVILVRDEFKGSRIMALNLATGKPEWEQKRTSPSSNCTPILWDTPSGKEIVAAGHARMVAYDFASGAEKWMVTGLPSGCCPSPVVADGTLFFAGWSPGGADDKENQMPPFEVILMGKDKDKDGKLSREEGDKDFGAFFDSMDANKDGFIVKEEYGVVLKFMAEGKNTAFALKAGGSGDVTDSHMLWKQSKGLPYIASAIVYGGQYVMVKDGGIVTAFDPKTGDQIYMQRTVATGKYYASPVAANGNIYFTSLEDGAVTVLKAGAEKPVVVAKNPPLGERVGATPAIADDTIYIRTEKNIYAFGEGK